MRHDRLRLPAAFAVLVFTLLMGDAMSAARAETSSPVPKRHPVTVGTDACYISADPPFDPWGDAAWQRAVKDLGIQFLVYHFDPRKDAEETRRWLLRIDDGMRANGLRYTLNLEYPNWVKTLEWTPGVNLFAQPDGTHRWDLPMEWLREVLPPRRPGRPALEGITFDETEHMQLTGHQFANYPAGEPLDKPQLAVTDGLGMEEAYERLTAACLRLRTGHYEKRLRLATEQVWPDMFHIYARAGWTVAPKLLKENLGSVVMATAMGAALQYRREGAALWASPDLWFRGEYPGHSPRALRSALLMGYWLGADTLYVENLDFQEFPSRHPEADPRGSLLRQTEDGGFVPTAHGRVMREFYREYIPAHPRFTDWRDYRPRVAIVRLPDGAWGQRGTAFRDRLLGSRQHPMDDVSAEWLQVWPVLTHGSARPGAISLNNGTAYPEARRPFFVPLDSVAVFDHRVTGSVLDSVECFVVCGHALSAPTFEAIRRRVAKGATCVIARRLFDRHAAKPLPGKWVVVDRFDDPTVAAALRPFLGPPDVARFRFKTGTVEFRPTNGDRDDLQVTVTRP